MSDKIQAKELEASMKKYLITFFLILLPFVAGGRTEKLQSTTPSTSTSTSTTSQSTNSRTEPCVGQVTRGDQIRDLAKLSSTDMQNEECTTGGAITEPTNPVPVRIPAHIQ